MSRRGWTIYDDDTRDFEQELEGLEHVNTRLEAVMEFLRKKNGEPTKIVDHFESESELFEL